LLLSLTFSMEEVKKQITPKKSPFSGN